MALARLEVANLEEAIPPEAQSSGKQRSLLMRMSNLQQSLKIKQNNGEILKFSDSPDSSNLHISVIDSSQTGSQKDIPVKSIKEPRGKAKNGTYKADEQATKAAGEAAPQATQMSEKAVETLPTPANHDKNVSSNRTRPSNKSINMTTKYQQKLQAKMEMID